MKRGRSRDHFLAGSPEMGNLSDEAKMIDKMAVWSLLLVLMSTIGMALCPTPINWTREMVDAFSVAKNLTTFENQSLHLAYQYGRGTTVAPNNGTHVAECKLCDTMEDSGCDVYPIGSRSRVATGCTGCIELTLVGSTDDNQTELVSENSTPPSLPEPLAEREPEPAQVPAPVIINNTQITREVTYVDNRTHTTEIINNTPTIENNINNTNITRNWIGNLEISLFSSSLISVGGITIIGLTIFLFVCLFRKKKE